MSTLNFKSPCIEDKQWVDPIAKASGNLFYGCSFGTLFIWRERYKIKICEHNGILFISYGGEGGGRRCFCFPVYRRGTPNSEIENAVNLILKYCDENDINPCFAGMLSENIELLQSASGGAFECTPDRDNFEYIYNSEDLANLSGRKYHSKRNHVAQFGKRFDWTYEELNSGNILEAKSVARAWCQAKGCGKIDDLHSEYCSIKEAVNNFDKLGFFGGLIRVDGAPAAMTIGEEVFEDMAVVHYEKALDEYPGAYAAINNCFAKDLLKRNYKYINREEDLGIEGLRKAKLSYKPEILLEKFVCVKK